MFRKAIPVFVALVMIIGLIGLSAAPAHAGTQIALSYTLPTAQINATDAAFSVPVNLVIPADKPVSAIGFSFKWNPAVFDMTAVDYGTLFDNHSDPADPLHTSCPTTTDPSRSKGTINQAAGTLTGFSSAGIGIGYPTQGCTGTGLIATLHFKPKANGKSLQTFTGTGLGLNLVYNTFDANQNPTAHYYTAADYANPDFTMYVGSAPSLVVSSISFAPNGGTPPGSNFITTVTVKNIGAVASDPVTGGVVVTTDGNATPASSTFDLLGINGGATQTFTVNMSMGANKSSSNVTATIPSFNNNSLSNTYSPVNDGGQTKIDASFGAFLKINYYDQNVHFGQLKLGGNNVGGSININSNTNYEVDVTDDGHAWKMTEWTGTGYATTPKHLQTNMLVVENSGAFPAVTNPGGKLLSGGVAGQGAGDSGQTFGLTFHQDLFYSDPMLSGGETYNLILNWNAFVTQ